MRGKLLPSRSKESSPNMLESLPEVNMENNFMQRVFTGAVNNLLQFIQ